MKSLRYVSCAVAIAAAAGLMTPVAHAQSGATTTPAKPDISKTQAIVMIVDYEGILAQASAMQDVKKQLKARQDTYKAEIDKRQTSLRDEEKKLAQQRTLLSADVFQEKQKALQAKVVDLQKFAQSRRRVLDEALVGARQKFQKQLVQIIEKVAEERGATLVLHKAEVILHASAMDASKDIFDRVNKAMPTLKVEFKDPS